MKHAVAVVCSALLLASCAIATREQNLVNRGLEAMGGAERLAGIKTISFKGTARYWEPEQSDVPGGEMRFANESAFSGVTDAAARATRIDWVRNYAYPAPRTFTYSEITTPEAGYVIGVDSNGRNAQSLKSSPPAHSMSGLRLATAQRELRRGGSAGLMLAMHRNPDKVQPAADIDGHPAVSFDGFVVAFDPATGLPSRVRTLDYDNIWGDVTYDVVFSDWREVGGSVRIPLCRRYELNGRRVSEASFTELQFNAPVDAASLQIPADVRATASKPATRNVPYQWVIRRQFIGVYMDSDNASYDTRGSQGLRLQEIAPGVLQVQGGTHNSLVVEMSDHLIVLDAPVTAAIALARGADARALPGQADPLARAHAPPYGPRGRRARHRGGGRDPGRRQGGGLAFPPRARGADDTQSRRAGALVPHDPDPGSARKPRHVRRDGKAGGGLRRGQPARQGHADGLGAARAARLRHRHLDAGTAAAREAEPRASRGREYGEARRARAATLRRRPRLDRRLRDAREAGGPVS
jgi:hypothetical protein